MRLAVLTSVAAATALVLTGCSASADREPLGITPQSVTVPAVTVDGPTATLGDLTYTLPAGATYETVDFGDDSAAHIITLKDQDTPSGTLIVEGGAGGPETAEAFIDEVVEAAKADAASTTLARATAATWAPFDAAYAATGSLTPAAADAPLDALTLTGYDADTDVTATLSLNAPEGTLATSDIAVVAQTITLN